MRYLEWCCWLWGIVLLGLFCATEARTHVFQMRSNSEIERAAQRTAALEPSTMTPDYPIDSLVGRIEIPRLKLTSVIEEGDDSSSLSEAVGHIPGTSLPGDNGNVGLAAHRDTFFRGLAKIKEGDEIVLTTRKGPFHYRVETTGVVQPDQTSVLRPVGVAALTLVTCYPFYYVGPAPNRYIVTAFLSEQRFSD